MTSTIKYILIAIIASLLFFPFLGQVHLFDWDEINFAECAREMIVTDNYLQVQIDYQPFWEKPPLFIWLQVLSMKLFGINDYAARFPNALIGVITLLTLFYVGKRVVHEKMAMWWVGLYAASWLPHFYFKSGIIDPTFNLFIFLSFFQMYLVRYGRQAITHSILAGVFLGLAVLTKGPVAILVAMLSLIVYIVINKGLYGYKIKHLLTVTLFAFLTTALWFGAEILTHGWWMVNQFITYQIRLFTTQDAGHSGPFFYHFIILLLGCFPASVFLLRKPNYTGEAMEVKDFSKWMWVMFWVVLILFSIVKTKIVHYSSLCYFPLTFLAAMAIYKTDKKDISLPGYMRNIMLWIGVILAIAIALLPVAGTYMSEIKLHVKDPFAVANMEADVPWSLAEATWGILYLIGLVVGVLMMKKDFRKGMLVLFATQIMIIQVTVLHFTPKVEAFSQRAAIEFFEQFQGKDVYVKVLGYKSYAHMYYSRKMPQPNDNHNNEEWLLNGDIDKPAYFICKITTADKYRALPQLEEIGSKNGFVFFKRK